MDFYVETITAEATYPVTLPQAKDALHIEYSDLHYDAHLNLLIGAATSEFERRTKNVTMSRVLRQHTTLAGSVIELPAPPLISLDTFESRDDTDDSWVAVDSDDYALHSARTPALIEMDEAPVYTRAQYTCGYADRADVPVAWKNTILQLVVFFHENHGDVEAKFPLALESLLRGQHCGTWAGYFGHAHEGYWQYKGVQRYAGSN